MLSGPLSRSYLVQSEDQGLIVQPTRRFDEAQSHPPLPYSRIKSGHYALGDMGNALVMRLAR